MPEALMLIMGQDSSKMLKIALIITAWAQAHTTWKEDSLESTQAIVDEVVKFMVAYEVVMVAQIMSLEQAAALRYFFIPSSWGTSKMPAWARAWADVALKAHQHKIVEMVK